MTRIFTVKTHEWDGGDQMRDVERLVRARTPNHARRIFVRFVREANKIFKGGIPTIKAVFPAKIITEKSRVVDPWKKLRPKNERTQHRP